VRKERPAPRRLARLAIASRLGCAVLGGYALAAAGTAAFAVALPRVGVARADAVLFATLFSFILYAAAVLWAFAARSAWRAWTGLLLPLLACAAITWLLAKGAA
jgi:hypothetical protein